MFARFIACIVLVLGIYLLGIFVAPEFTDFYGFPDINAKIRIIKDQSLQFASGSESPGSLVDKVIDSGKAAIDSTNQTVNQIQTTIDQKTDQAKTVIESVNKTYDALNTTKNDIQNFATFSGSSQ